MLIPIARRRRTSSAGKRSPAATASPAVYESPSARQRSPAADPGAGLGRVLGSGIDWFCVDIIENYTGLLLLQLVENFLDNLIGCFPFGSNGYAHIEARYQVVHPGCRAFTIYPFAALIPFDTGLY